MSDLEYQRGRAMENAHIAQGRADAKLNQQMGRIEAQRSSALQSAAINNDKLMKYLPAQLKAMGMSNLGVAQSSYVRAANDYASQRGAINQQFNDAASAAWDAYADGQAQRDIQLNQSISDLERYYGEKEEQKAKEADDKFLNMVRSDNWNSPEELEAFINDYDGSGRVSEDAIATARYLLTGYTGKFSKAEEDESRAANLTALEGELLAAVTNNFTEEMMMDIARKYEGKVDPIQYESILSQIKSHAYGAKNKEIAKNDTDFITNVRDDIWNSPQELEEYIAKAEASGNISAKAIEDAKLVLNNLTGDFTKAEEERAKAEAEAIRKRYESELGGVVRDGIATNMSPDEIRNLTAKYYGKVDNITWTGFMDDIAIYEAAWNDYQQKEQTAEQQAITAEADAKAQFIIDNISRMTQTQARSEIDAIKDQLSPSMAWMVEMAMNMHVTEVEVGKIEEEKAAAEKAAADATKNSDAQISDIFSFENYEDYNGTPEDLWEDLSPYLDTASPTVEQAAKRKYEDFERWYEEQAAFTEQEELAVQQMETDSNVLEGRIPVEYNTQRWIITGEAMDPKAVNADDDFKEALEDIMIVTPVPGSTHGSASYSRGQIKTPYDEKLQNGMTVTVRKKTYTFYNGEWYPSEKSK